MKTVLLLSITATAALAQVQNMDFSFLFGGATSNESVALTSGGPVISGSAGFTTLLAYGYQVVSAKAGSLYLEVPQTFVFYSQGTVQGSTVSSIDRDNTYFTPGVRFKIPTGTRVSFYGAAGVGIAIFGEKDTVVDGQVIATNASVVHFAGDVGGGIDLRISRWFSLKAEVRDFISARGYGGTTGHNHPVFIAGFAFHL